MVELQWSWCDEYAKLLPIRATHLSSKLTMNSSVQTQTQVLGLDIEIDGVRSANDCIYITCSDGRIDTPFPKEMLFQSKLIQTMCQFDKKETEIPLPGVTMNDFLKIVEFLQHHHGNEMAKIPKPIPCSDLSQFVSSFDEEFVNIRTSRLFELCQISNKLHIQSLLDLICAKIASKIRNKTQFEVLQEFSQEQDNRHPYSDMSSLN